MDAFAPILVAIILVTGGAIAYQRQKRVDRKEALIVQRRTVYKAFIDTVFEHADKQNDETRRAYDHSKSEMLLIASDSVLEKMVWLQEAMTMDGNATGPEDVLIACTGVIKEMRKDCFEGTNMTEDKLEYISGIGKRTPLHGSVEGHFEPH